MAWFQTQHDSRQPFASQERSYRVPSPPHMLVPPPMMVGGRPPEIKFIKRPDPQGVVADAGDLDFLKAVDYENLRLYDNVMEWKYEHRRTAQEILPFVYLGPVAAARNATFLKNEGITMVIAVRNTLSAQAHLLEPKAPKELGIASHTVDVAGNPSLIAALSPTIQLINHHLSEKYRHAQALNGGMELSVNGGEVAKASLGKVLIFCESGNERSAALVVAYIMAIYAVDLVQALHVVQSQRFCVALDDPLRYLLQSYEDILKARRDVAAFPNASPGSLTKPSFHPLPGQAGSSPQSRKRGIDQAYEDHDEMMDLGPEDSLSRREGYAPFAD